MRRPSGRILIPVGLAVVGAAAIALVVAAEVLRIGRSGLGAAQITLLAVGAAWLLSGVGLATEAGWEHASVWWQELRGDGEPVGILLVAVWFGLVTGWGHAVVLMVRREYLGQLILMGIDYGWMIPLANLVLFIVLGVVLALLHRRWPRVVSRETATFLLAWVASLGLLLLVRRVSPLALVILAAGIAVQVGRLATRHARGFSTMVRFSVGWPVLLGRPRKVGSSSRDGVGSAALAGAVGGVVVTRRQFLLGATASIAAVALGTRGGQAVAERGRLARLIQPTSRMPNVVLIVLDTVRAQSMSLYGYSRQTTPNLERLATQGTLFTRAIAPSSWTLPSHASMFTGHLPHEYTYGWLQTVLTRYPFLAEMLSDAGYVTAGFVANSGYCGRQFGLARGFVHYEDYRVTPGQAFVYTSLGTAAINALRLFERFGTDQNFGRKSAGQVNADFLRWLSREARRPFFAFLNYYDAHDPYLPPAAFGLKFADHIPRGFVRSEDASALTGEEVRELQDAYDGSIAYLDHEMGALFDALGALHVLDDTVVVITSDHGEHLGDHNLLMHGNSLYRSLVQVPLLFLWPGQIPAGTVVPETVGLVDLPATVLELANIPTPRDLPGRSLAGYWHGSRAVPEETVYSEVDITSNASGGPMLPGWYQSLVSSQYHYILRPDGKEELYGFEGDPEEVSDLSETAVGRSAVEQLRMLLPRI